MFGRYCTQALILTKLESHEHSSENISFLYWLVQRLPTKSTCAGVIYLPIVITSGAPRKINFFIAQKLIISCYKYLIKDLLDQRLVPIAPPGLHSAQTRHGSFLRELVRFEQLAPDHDLSVKIPNVSFEYKQN